MNWIKIGRLALQSLVAVTVLMLLFCVVALLIALTMALWFLTEPVVELFGTATLILIPIGFGIIGLGWVLAGRIIKWIERDGKWFS